MSKKTFAIDIGSRRLVADSKRRTGFSVEKVHYQDLNELFFRTQQEHILGTSSQVTAKDATMYYQSSDQTFRDINAALVTPEETDRIWIVGIDTLTNDLDFSGTDKLEIESDKTVTLNNSSQNIIFGDDTTFDITVSNASGIVKGTGSHGYINGVKFGTGISVLSDGATIATDASLGNTFTLDSPARTDLSSGSLVIGVDYYLQDWISPDSFTNVGANSNDDGVEFTATGTTPATWANSSIVRRVPVMSNPTNLVAGRTYYWIITQDATGGVKIHWDTNFKFNGDDAVDTGANAVTVVQGVVESPTSIRCSVLSTVGLKQYTGTVPGGGGDFEITDGATAVARAVAIPYQTIDGTWRFRGNFAVTFGASSSIDIEVAGILSPNVGGGEQAISVYQTTDGSTAVITAFMVTNSDSFRLSFDAGSITSAIISFDVELVSKPTWAD